MLLRHRPPDVDATPVTLPPGLAHIDPAWVDVLRWLNVHKVDFVLVGPVAHAIRGEVTARGPVAIVPAPYGRNYERLAKALVAQNAALRSEPGPSGAGGIEIELTSEKLARGRRWLFDFAGYSLDVENAGRRGGEAGGVRYQELLYETTRVELAPGLAVEVAAPEDLEMLSHLGRTGTAPEFRVTRGDGTVREAERARRDPGDDS